MTALLITLHSYSLEYIAALIFMLITSCAVTNLIISNLMFANTSQFHMTGLELPQWGMSQNLDWLKGD